MRLHWHHQMHSVTINREMCVSGSFLRKNGQSPLMDWPASWDMPQGAARACAGGLPRERGHGSCQPCSWAGVHLWAPILTSSDRSEAPSAAVVLLRPGPGLLLGTQCWGRILVHFMKILLPASIAEAFLHQPVRSSPVPTSRGGAVVRAVFECRLPGTEILHPVFAGA